MGLELNSLNLESLSISEVDLASSEDNAKIWELRHLRGNRTGDVVEVELYPLGGAKTFLRTGSSDPIVVHETFLQLYHVPPSEVGNVKSLLDLGSNIGLTIAHYATLFPNAKCIGVELDKNTAEIASKNTEFFRDRVKIINGAVWVSDEPVTFGATDGEEYGNRIGGDGHQIVVNGYSINTLIDMLGVDVVDFVKMDVEGAEIDLLRKNAQDWAPRVKSMLIELHGYPLDEAIEDLKKLGFHARKDSRHWESVFAIKIAYD
jgi:FkbM family methyltransferase